MATLPVEFHDALNRGDVVLYCGAGISMSAGGIPGGGALASELCTRAGLPPEENLALAARSYERMLGRQSLLAYLGGRLAPFRLALPTHVQVARIPWVGIVTTNWDELIERAFQDVGRPYDLVVRDGDTSFLSSGRTPIVKVHGTLSQLDTLVVTDADAFGCFGRNAVVATLLRAWFASRTILFVGYGLGDPDFKSMFYESKRVLGNLQRRAYAVQRHATATEVADWRAENIEIIVDDALSFLTGL